MEANLYDFLAVLPDGLTPVVARQSKGRAFNKTKYLVDLNARIDRLKKEILRLRRMLWSMDRWEEDPDKAYTKYTPEYIEKNRTKIQAEYRKLNIEKIQLVYLAGMMEYS